MPATQISEVPRSYAQTRQNIGLHATLHVSCMARTLPILPVSQPEAGFGNMGPCALCWTWCPTVASGHAYADMLSVKSGFSQNGTTSNGATGIVESATMRAPAMREKKRLYMQNYRDEEKKREERRKIRIGLRGPVKRRARAETKRSAKKSSP